MLAQTARHLDRTQTDRRVGVAFTHGFARPVVERLVTMLFRGTPRIVRTTYLAFQADGTLPTLSAGLNRGDTDLWLFLARHVGLPTRCSID